MNIFVPVSSLWQFAIVNIKSPIKSRQINNYQPIQHFKTMKKTTLLSALLLLTFIAQSQIVFEHDYPGSTSITKLSISGNKYYLMDWTNSQCKLYNMDHSVWKTINLSVPAGNYLYDIKFVSETLFNLDAKVELAYVYYSYDSTLYYYTYVTKVINEDGNELLAIPGAEYSEAINSASNGTKYLAYVYDYSVLPYTVNTMVYSVPGQLSSDGQDDAGLLAKPSPAFPNPCHSSVTIPYTLPKGTTNGEILLIDSNGKTLRTFKLDNAFSDLQLNTTGMPQGLYFYRITAEGQVSSAGKIIVE